MSGERTISGAIRVGAQARWGANVQCARASSSGRYAGPVFIQGDALVQRVAPDLAIVHRREGLDFSGSAALARRAAANRLNDAHLAIDCIGAKGKATLVGAPDALTALGAPAATRAGTSPPDVTRIRRRKRGAIQATAALIVGTAAACALAACARDRLVTPDGADRVAVNTPASLSKYQDLVARDDALTLERSVLERKVEALTTEVDALKSYILERARKEKSELPAPAPANTPATDTPGATAHPTGNATAIGADRVVFRVTHAIGETRFNPPEEVKTELLEAARSAQSVVIRGRTDAQSADPLETRIALRRAVNARAYLVGNGVQPQKIRTWYRAAGGFVADNSTPAGRALNRRVEIEARGVVAAQAVPPSDTRLGSAR